VKRCALLLAAVLGLVLTLTPPASAADDTFFDYVWQQNATFYPLHHDGYKDRTEVHFSTTDYMDTVSWQVTDDYGDMARFGSVSDYDEKSFDWTWNGIAQDGGMVDPGDYHVRFTVTDYDGTSYVLSRDVTVATKTVTKQDSIRVPGAQFDWKRIKGNCSITKSSGQAWLDCWAGAYAQTSYSVHLPRKAFDIDAQLRGRVRCCEPGKVTRTVTHPKPNLFRGTVTVTNWRAFDVRDFYVTWKYKKTL